MVWKYFTIVLTACIEKYGREKQMNINSINLVHFSPVCHTRRISQLICKELAKNLGISKQAEYDITKPTSHTVEIGASNLVILAVPVFGGRVPKLAIKHLRSFRGEGTPAILVVSYGNRAFEDALLELKDVAAELDFRPLAAAACIAEHTIVPSIAFGRPDDADIQSISDFSDSVSKLLSTSKLCNLPDIVLPGNRPYKEYSQMTLPQHVDENCVKCGKCANECPASAISASDPSQMNINKCFCCMRCINICPMQARHPDKAFINSVFEILDACCGTAKKKFILLSCQ